MSKEIINIVLPNVFFTYHGINPETRDGYILTCLINGEPKLVHLLEEEYDEYGNQRYSYEG